MNNEFKNDGTSIIQQQQLRNILLFQIKKKTGNKMTRSGINCLSL